MFIDVSVVSTCTVYHNIKNLEFQCADPVTINLQAKLYSVYCEFGCDL